MHDREVFEKLAGVANCGMPVCLATIVETQGSTPREVGAKMLIWADGTIYGSIGGGYGETQVRTAARQCLLMDRKPRIVEVELTSDSSTREGDVCGGRMFINIEPYFRDSDHGLSD